MFGELSYDPEDPAVREIKDADGRVTAVYVAPPGTQPPWELSAQSSPALDPASGWVEIGSTEQGWKFQTEPTPDER